MPKFQSPKCARIPLQGLMSQALNPTSPPKGFSFGVTRVPRKAAFWNGQTQPLMNHESGHSKMTNLASEAEAERGRGDEPYYIAFQIWKIVRCGNSTARFLP